MSEYIGLVQLSELAEILRQAIEKAVTRQSREPSARWRGSRLVLRTSLGRGGRSGWSFEVRIDSLPADLQARFNALQRPVQLALKLDDASAADRDWWTAVLAPGSRHPARSKERTAAVRAIVAAEHIRDGRRIRVPERTVLRKLAALDAHGFAGLTRKKRVGAGERAVILSQAWDKAVPFDEGKKSGSRTSCASSSAGCTRAARAWHCCRPRPRSTSPS